MWKPPFSLDLSGINPDIVYCVEIFNITCGSSDLVLADCDVQKEWFTIVSYNFIYSIAITPRSNVTGSDNGTKIIIDGLYNSLLSA